MAREIPVAVAINEALCIAMQADPDVILMGEDVAGGGLREGDGIEEMGETCAAAGDRPQAVKYLRRAIDAGGDWPDVHVRLGDLLAEEGSLPLARTHYKQALSLNGKYEAAARRLAALTA